MAKYQNQIEYSITTKLDSKGLTQLQNQIREVEASLSRLATKKDSDPFNFGESIQQLQKLNKALSSSFDSSLGMLNISKLKTELKDAGVTANQLGQAFSQGGAQGRIAFNNLLGQIGKIDTGLKRTSTTVDKMFNTISNTVRWGIVSSGFSAMLNSLHQSVDYVKELDDSLTQIMLVTDYSRQQMQEYAKSANEAAKALGATTVDVTRGSQVFAQQGFDIQQSSQLAELSIKLANASEQDSATTSDQITALMNAYGLEGNISKLSKALDSWALVANISAADVQELAKASQKAASSANATGVSLDQMNAQIATIESVTRDAPEQIGNGLKTLYARLSDISLGKTLEDGVDLGKVTLELQKVGVQVLDQAGQMRNVGDILEDLMSVWGGLDKTSQKGAAEAIAGKYQLNRFYALMGNSDMYQQFKEGSTRASGTLDQMNQEHLNSMAGRMAKFQATLEGLFNSVFNPDNFYPAIDALTNFVDLINKLVDSIGGGQTVLTGIIALFGKLFSNNIAQSINDTMMNRRMDQVRQENAKNTPALLAELGLAGANENNQQIIDFAQYMQANQGSMSKEQVENANKILEENITATNRWEQALDNVETEAQQINFILSQAYDEPTKVTKDANGKWNFDSALTELQGLDKINSADIVKRWNGELEKLQQNLFTIADAQNTAFNTSSIETFNREAQKIDTIVDQARFGLDNLKGALNPEDYMALSHALDVVQQELKDGAKAAGEDAESLKKAALTVDELSKKLQGLTFTRDDVKVVTGRAVQTLSEANVAQGGKEASNNILSAYQENFNSQKNIKNIVDTTTAIGELAFAWQSFQNLGSIWKNEDISSGEKILQVLMNLSMVIPSLLSSFKTLKNSSIDIFSSFKEFSDNKNLLKGTKNIEKEAEKILSTRTMIEEMAQNKVNISMDKAEKAHQKYSTAESAYQKNLAKSHAGLSKDMSAPNRAKKNNALENYRTELKNLDEAEQQLTKTQEASKNAQESYTKAQEKTTQATQNLHDSSIKLATSIGMIALSIGATAFSMYIDYLNEMRQRAQEAANATLENSNKIEESKQKWEEYYKESQETNKVSQEFIEYSKQISEELDIASGNAYIAAGNFKELANEIDRISESEIADSIDKINTALKQETSIGQNIFASLPFIGTESVHSEIREGFRAAQRELAATQLTTGLGVTNEAGWSRRLNQDFYDIEKSDAIEVVNKLDNEIQYFKDMLEKVDEGTPDEKALKAIIDELEISKGEKYQQTKENIKNLFSQRIKQDDFQEDLKSVGTNVDAIIEKFKTDEGTSGWFNQAKEGAEQLNLALQGVTDEAQKTALSLVQMDTVFSEKMTEKASSTIQNAIDKGQTSFEKLGVKNSEEYGQYTAQYLQEQIQNSGLTDSERLEFLASIDWNKSLGEISKQIEEINRKNTENLPKLEFKATLTDRSNFSEEETKNLLEETKMSESSLNRMASDIFSDNENFKEKASEIESELNKINNSIEKGKEPTEEQAERIQKLRQEYEDLGDSAKDVATYNLQMNKGIANLVKNWQNYADVLKDDATKGTSDYYQAIGELDEIMSDILNIDPGVLSNGFYENEAALEAMARAAEGDVTAIDELRKIAVEDIILHLDIEGMSGEEETTFIEQELMPLLNDFQSILDGAPLGMSVDVNTDPFLHKLNQLLEEGQLTAEQVSNILSSAGMEADIDFKEAETESYQYVPTYRIEMKTVSPAGPMLDGSTMPSVSYPEIIPTGVVELPYKEKIKVPYLKGATYTGPGVQTVGASSSGNAPHKSSSGGGGSCFVADTLITMHGFYKKIQEVTKGDIVLSYNETSKINEYSQVIQTMIHATTEKIYTLYIKDEQLKVTGIHRFFIKRNNIIDWIEASDLKVGDLVFLANGTWTKIFDISVNIETRYVYNFEVSNNHNYYVGTNRILAHNKGGSGGSGGGGGSGKTYEPKKKDPIEEEIDLYEKVNTQLDDVEETLKGIQQETDRLIGPKGRANMNQQIKLLQKEINLQKEKLKIQEKERDKLRGQLSNFDVKFDSEGFISNYADVLKGLEEKYNDLIRQYNATGDEEGQEALEHRIEKFKERIDKFKDLYKRYDELQGKEIKDTKNQIEDLTNSIEDLRIEAYKAAQEAIDDLKELRDNAADLLGLFTEYKTDSPFRATIVDAEKLKNIFGGTKKEAIDYYQAIIDKNQELLSKTTNATERQTYQSYINFFKEQQQNAANNPLGTGLLGLASQDLERLQKWIDNPNTYGNPFGENTAALYEAYEDAYNRMSELAFESEKAWEQLEEDIIDGYDEIAEKEEEQIDRYDRLTDRLETIADMMGLAYGDTQYADMAKIYDQIGRSTFQQLQDQKTITEIWEKRYNEISDKTSDVAKAVQQHMEEAQDKLIEIQKEVIDAWQKAFENAMKELTAQEYKSILGVRQPGDVSSDWERDKEYASKYYDNVQKANLIEQLRLKYMDLLDDAQGSSLDTQRRIRDAMNEQVDYLEKQGRLSEFNVKYANAQLEILQKQIALEDARNNKNQMRLRRDTQGNYRYVYTANQDDVRGKEADLLQSEFDAYNMSTENRMNTYSDWLNAYQNYMDQREALLQRVEQGDQEAADALEKLEADFARDMAAYSEELSDSWEGMVGALQWMTETGTDYIKDMAEIAMTAIEERTEESLGNVGIQWNETVNNAIYSLNDLLSTHASITSDMMNQANKYKDIIQNQVAPTVVNSFNDINGATASAAYSTRDLAAATKELNDALASDNAALVEATKKLEDYRKQLDDVKNSSAVTAQQLRQAQAELDRTKAQNLNYKTIIENGFSEGQTVTLKAGTKLFYDRKANWQQDNTGSYGFTLDKDTTVEILTMHEKNILGNPNSGDAKYAVTVFPPGQKADPESAHEARLSSDKMKRQVWHLSESMLREAMLDTGGYTGEWEDGISGAKNGKIAFLHQKELVLNANDTENILQAVKMIRTITDISKVFSTFTSLSKGTEANKLGGDTIKQRVEITAEFPNVQDSKEIENALLSIADSAYQYSYRTR